MQSMSITLEDIKTAYRETGLKPTFRACGQLDGDGVRCACVVTALAIWMEAITWKNLTRYSHDDPAVQKALGMSRREINMLIDGFCIINAFTTDPYYLLGRQAREWAQEMLSLAESVEHV